MTVLITGVTCVGKTAVGEALAKSLGVPFADLDQIVERQLGAPIARLQQRYGTMARYREAAAGVLADLLASFDGRRVVVALPPSGLRGPYWRRLKGRPVVTVALEDAPENILERIRFYDDDSRPIDKCLTPRERTHYLREIRGDMAYFGRSYRKADIRIMMSGCSVTEAASRIEKVMRELGGTQPAQSGSEHPAGG